MGVVAAVFLAVVAGVVERMRVELDAVEHRAGKAARARSN
jgi:hypothetical protein